MRPELKCRTDCQHNFNCGHCFSNGQEPGLTYIKRHSSKLHQKVLGGHALKPAISTVDKGTVELGNQYFWLRAGTVVRK